MHGRLWKIPLRLENQASHLRELDVPKVVIRGVVEANPGGEKPFLLVFRNGVGVLASVPVESESEGEAIADQIFERLDLFQLLAGPDFADSARSSD